MTTLHEIIREYLSHDEDKSLSSSYPQTDRKHDNLSLEEKSNLLQNFYNEVFVSDIFETITGSKFNMYSNYPSHIGSGSQGAVFALKLHDLSSCVKAFKNKALRIKHADKEAKNIDIACKIQLINNPKEKYWEARMLREESVMMKLNRYATIKENIPEHFLGFTVEHNGNFFRCTMMELIYPGRYIDLLTAISNISGEQSKIIIESVKKVVYTLWKNGISHNDISVRNIMVDTWNISNIKLIDFGLATCFVKIGSSDKNIEEEYSEYFKNLSKDEQHGSNVKKLGEVVAMLTKP